MLIRRIHGKYLSANRDYAERNRAHIENGSSLGYFFLTESSPDIWEFSGASKIKLKNVNKKRMATARRLIFWNFSRHPLLI
jgi:hypothetical protein